MTEAEKLLRMEALTEMFIGSGEELEDERLRYYGNCTQHIPIDVFKNACRQAAMDRGKGFAPSVGEIINAARKLAPGERSPGHGYGAPAWLRRQLTDNSRREKPQELDTRGALAERILEKMK